MPGIEQIVGSSKFFSDKFSTGYNFCLGSYNILSFTAVFAGLGIHVASGRGPAAALVARVLRGSAAWWIVMTGPAALVRERVTPAVARGIAVVSGILLVGFGVLSALRALR